MKELILYKIFIFQFIFFLMHSIAKGDLHIAFPSNVISGVLGKRLSAQTYTQDFKFLFDNLGILNNL